MHTVLFVSCICFRMIVMSQSHSKEHNSQTHTHTRVHRKRNKNSVYIVTQIELRIRAYQTNIDTGTQINPVQWTKKIKITKNEEKKNNVCNWFEQTSLKKNINYLMNILVCWIVSYIIILFFFFFSFLKNTRMMAVNWFGVSISNCWFFASASKWFATFVCLYRIPIMLPTILKSIKYRCSIVNSTG